MAENEAGLAERWLNMEFFTEYHRITGEVLTAELRTNGVMNAADPHILLERASTGHLARSTDPALVSGFARVAKESIFVAIPNDVHETERLERATKIYGRGELLQQRVLIVLGNFEVSGNLHLPPGTALHQVLLYRNEFFVGVTDVVVSFLPNPGTRFTASSVLINRGLVDFLCAGAPYDLRFAICDLRLVTIHPQASRSTGYRRPTMGLAW